MSRLIVLVFTMLLCLPGDAHAEDCPTPRAAVAEFLDNLQTDRYSPEAAVRCFDFSAGPTTSEERLRIARELLAVLDGQGKYVVYADVPAEADFVDPASGMARVILFPTLPDVRLEKIGDRWLIAASTVAAVPRLYERTFRLPLERLTQRLPPPFHQPVLGVAAWQGAGLLLLLVLAALVGGALRMSLGVVLRRGARRFFPDWEMEYERAILRWSGRLAAAGVAAILLPNLALPVRANQIGITALQLAACVSAVLILHSLVDFFADALARRAASTETTMDDALVPLARRVTKLIVDVAGVLFVLQNMDVDIGSLLATLGLGGLAFALAAKESLSNLFGFVTIIADRPFQIGDWVDIGGTEGTVEEVGIRSTRVRTFYDSIVTLPNATVAQARIDNYGRRRRRRFKLHLGLTYETSAAQLEAFIAGVRESLADHELVRDGAEVHLHRMAASSLDILVYSFIVADSWTAELATRQDLMIQWRALAERIGVDFAYPTTTVHLPSTEDAA